MCDNPQESREKKREYASTVTALTSEITRLRRRIEAARGMAYNGLRSGDVSVLDDIYHYLGLCRECGEEMPCQCANT
jgi:hypothetical protein